MALSTAKAVPTRISRFRPLISGPEQAIERAVARAIFRTLKIDPRQAWLGASAPIGAGRPDLLIVSYNPQLLAFRSTSTLAAHVLAYLHRVPRAGLNSIARGVSRPPQRILPLVSDLLSAGALNGTIQSFSLSPIWRRILTDVVAIEAKVADWKSGARQAARNRLLAHRSFLALPRHVAQRAAADPYVTANGLGILEVDTEGCVRIVRPSRRSNPRVPYYYYSVAALVARR